MTSSIAWIIWVLAGMVFFLSTRNPFYLIIGILGLLFLGRQLAVKRDSKNWIRFNIRFISMMILLSSIINAMFSHVGQRVLFTLPAQWPLIGGNITLESMVYGAINGLVISALYLQFNILNLGMQIQQVVRLIPRAFHPIAMMISISLTFFPSIHQRVERIKEAQLIRGNSMKKISDWLPILIPLLVSSLENAILLSESMTTRGFHTTTTAKPRLVLAGFILGTFAIFSGWILNLYQYPLQISISLYITGTMLILGLVYFIGRNSHVTRFHRETWTPGDYLVTVTMSLSLIALFLLSFSSVFQSRVYSPYPSLTIPELQTHGVLLSIVLVLPLFFISND